MLGRLLSLFAALMLASAPASAYAPEPEIARPALLAAGPKTAPRGIEPKAEPAAKEKSGASVCRVWEIWFPPLKLASSMGYTGYYLDQESGLNYAQQRYQLPGIGRFLQVDPWEGDTQRPITLNKYLYANGNPLTFIDPDGRAAHPCSAQPEGCAGYSGYETPAPVQAPRVVRAPAVAEQIQNPPPAPVEGPVMNAPYEGPLTGYQVQRVKMLEDKERARQSSHAFQRRVTNVLTMLAGPMTRDPDSVTGRQRVNVIDDKPLSASEQSEAITDAVEFGTLLAGPKIVRMGASRDAPKAVVISESSALGRIAANNANGAAATSTSGFRVTVEGAASGGRGFGAHQTVDRIAQEYAGAVQQANRILQTNRPPATAWERIYRNYLSRGQRPPDYVRGNALQQIADDIMRENNYAREAGIIVNRQSRVDVLRPKRPDVQVPISPDTQGIIDITTPGQAPKIIKYDDPANKSLLNVLYEQE